MIEQKSTLLKKIQEILSAQSCIKGEPFIKVGGGNAPSLSYNIPQSTCFSTYGRHTVKGIPTSFFVGYAQQAPANNYFDKIRAIDKAALMSNIDKDALMYGSADINIPGGLCIAKKVADKEALVQGTDYRAATPENVAAKAAPVDDSGSEPTPTPEPPIFPPINVNDSGLVLDKSTLADVMLEGKQPILVEGLGGFRQQFVFVKEPPKPTPFFLVIEEYTTCSYLGDYGAGRTLNTFSLLPGERTTLTIKTFKEITETQNRSDSLLDSFSESSTDEFANSLEKESGRVRSTTNSETKTSAGNFDAGVNLGIFGSISDFIGIDFGVDVSGGTSSSQTNTFSATRASNVKMLSKAFSKHVATANSNRQINVNTTTNESSRETEEAATVREIANINKSRVLNFVFRQLLQQYITLTTLSNIKIAFCNGYLESLRIVELEGLEQLLAEVIIPSKIETVRQAILKHYCHISNYLDQPVPFIERMELPLGECLGINETEVFWRIKKDTGDSYSVPGSNLAIQTNGPILNVQTNTIRTSSVVVDAFLGQGEALDCYNSRLQDADAAMGNLKNLALLQQMEIMEGITDPAQAADMYKKVFGTCCDTPQTQIIS